MLFNFCIFLKVMESVQHRVEWAKYQDRERRKEEEEKERERGIYYIENLS